MTTFPAPPEYLQVAKHHIATAEREIARQRTRIERLRTLGMNTSDAENLLDTFSQTLLVMRYHVDAETREPYCAVGAVDNRVAPSDQSFW